MSRSQLLADADADPQRLGDVSGIAKPQIELTRARNETLGEQPVHDDAAAAHEHDDAEPKPNRDVGRRALGREEHERRMVAGAGCTSAHASRRCSRGRDDETRGPHEHGAARLEDPHASAEAERVAGRRHPDGGRFSPAVRDVERLGLAGGEGDARRRDRNRDRRCRDHLPMTVNVIVEV